MGQAGHRPAVLLPPGGDLDLAVATPAQRHAFVASVIDTIGKGMLLAPDGRTLEAFTESSLPSGRLPTLRAEDIEDDLDRFAKLDRGLLTLTRYDGIDLPDHSCRLVILDGLPARGDLQERFLHGSLGALEVLQERIRARITQGAGRATRNPTDYAVVFLLGRDLTSFCARRDVQAAMHPEIQAELGFGIDNSFMSSKDMRENLRHFLGQDEEWQQVERHLIAERNAATRIPAPGSEQLQDAAQHEVAAWQAIWQGEWQRAVDVARQVIDKLAGGAPLRPYQALWNYLASSWAAVAAVNTSDQHYWELARRYHEAARAAARGTTWLAHLSAPTDQLPGIDVDQADPLDIVAADRIIDALITLGRPAVFEDAVVAMRTGLLASDPGPYEEALVTLGRFAGADEVAGSGGATAAPDATWRFGEQLWVAWEAKSDADPDGEVDVDDARQAGGHLRYMAGEHPTAIPTGSVVVISSPQTAVHPAARQIAEGHVYLVALETVVELADRLVRAWRTIRGRISPGTDSPGTRETVLSALASEEALPTRWLASVTTRSLATG